MSTTICPRCDSDQTAVIANSPKEGVFGIFRCSACNYVWRSTEDLSEIAKWIDNWRKNVDTSMLDHMK